MNEASGAAGTSGDNRLGLGGLDSRADRRVAGPPFFVQPQITKLRPCVGQGTSIHSTPDGAAVMLLVGHGGGERVRSCHACFVGPPSSSQRRSRWGLFATPYTFSFVRPAASAPSDVNRSRSGRVTRSTPAPSIPIPPQITKPGPRVGGHGRHRPTYCPLR